MKTNTSKTQPSDIKSRRKIVFIDPEIIMRMFSRGFVRHQVLNVPEALALPKTVEVIAVYSDYCRMKLAFVVQDPSFEPVPTGAAYPIVGGEIELKYRSYQIVPWPDPRGGKKRRTAK